MIPEAGKIPPRRPPPRSPRDVARIVATGLGGIALIIVLVILLPFFMVILYSISMLITGRI
jgi:hypothetical protein